MRLLEIAEEEVRSQNEFEDFQIAEKKPAYVASVFRKCSDWCHWQEADEFIIGLPRSCDGRETTQSNKVRSVAGRLAVRAAERWNSIA